MSNTHRFKTSQAAEAAFYAAFERADLEAMMRVWAEDESVICIHPAGPYLRGQQAIRASWERIFAPRARLRFTLEESHRRHDSQLSVHVLKEHIRLDGVTQGVMLATNVYQLIDGGWRMTLHHASPEPLEAAQAGTLH